MSNVTVNQRLSQHSELIKRRFDAKSGKLFLVDDSKILQVAALGRLIKESDAKSVLAVVRDVVTAQEYAKALQEATTKQFTVVDSKESFRKALGVSSDASCDELLKKAKSLASSHPYLVVCQTGVDGAVLFGNLCVNKTNSGSYSYEGREIFAHLTVSDVVSEARYDFVAVDDVYSFIKLKERKYFTFKDDKIDPLIYERVDFAGAEYYAESSQSYKKLQRLVGSGSKAVILSDSVFYDDMVNLYAALNLLSDDSYYKAKDFVTSRATYYDDVCEEVFNDVINSSMENTVINACYSEASASNQIAPHTIRHMDEFIKSNIDLMSKEEIVILALYHYAAKYQPNCNSVDNLMDELRRTDQNMGKSLGLIFFSDKLKGVLENNDVNKFGKWSMSDFKFMFEVFNEYGGLYLKYETDLAHDKVRIFGEGSAYQSISSSYYKVQSVDSDFAYLDDSNVDTYKCLAIKQMIAESRSTVNAPVIVVTFLGSDKLLRAAKGVFGSVTANVSDLGENRSQVAVINYGELFRIASAPNARSVVFFDLPLDITTFTKAINKVGSFGANATVLTGYGDASAQIYEIWKNVSERHAITLRVGEVVAEDGDTIVKVKDILQDVCDLSNGLNKLIDGNNGDLQAVKDKAVALSRSFPTASLGAAAGVERDMDYFAQISESISGIFGNSMTAGANGESVKTGDFVERRVKRGVKLEWISQFGTPITLFNACSKMIMRSCDLQSHDCNGCDKYLRFRKNDFEVFSKSVTDFFETSLKFIDESKTRKRAETAIQSADSGNGNDLEKLQASLKSGQAVANIQLRKIKNISSRTLFSVDYASICEIRRAVTDAFSNVLSKYLELIDEVCNNVSNKLKTVANDLNEGCSM